MLNRVTLVGRMTADPEITTTPNNKKKLDFRMAIEQDFKPKDGERKTDFISCVAWEGNAEFISKYIKKGDMFGIEGRLSPYEYEDKKEGVKRYGMNVIVDNGFFTENKRNKEG